MLAALFLSECLYMSAAFLNSPRLTGLSEIFGLKIIRVELQLISFLDYTTIS